MKLLVGVSLSAFGVSEDVSEQSPHVCVAEDTADATEMARQAQAGEIVGWDPGAEQERGGGRTDMEGER